MVTLAYSNQEPFLIQYSGYRNNFPHKAGSQILPTLGAGLAARSEIHFSQLFSQRRISGIRRCVFLQIWHHNSAMPLDLIEQMIYI